jgi:hypothetical protein
MEKPKIWSGSLPSGKSGHDNCCPNVAMMVGASRQTVNQVIGLAHPPDLSPPQLTGNFALTMPFGRIAIKF